MIVNVHSFSLASRAKVNYNYLAYAGLAVSVNSVAGGIDQTRMKLDDHENTQANTNQMQAHTLWRKDNARRNRHDEVVVDGTETASSIATALRLPSVLSAQV